MIKEELEKAAEDYADAQHNAYWGYHFNAFIAGAKWDREKQQGNDAVEFAEWKDAYDPPVGELPSNKQLYQIFKNQTP